MNIYEDIIGRKDDQEKLQWHLMPWDQMEEVVKVLMAGAKTYGDYNWKNVKELKERYSNALIRHAVKYQKGETIDPQFGLNHMAHAICCALFCMWSDMNATQN